MNDGFTFHPVLNGAIDVPNSAAMGDHRVEIFEKLVKAGYTKRQAGLMTGAVSAWMFDSEWDRGRSQSTRYRFLKALREHCGLDLREPCNFQPLAAGIKPQVVEIRELEVTDLPDWYRGTTE